MRPIVYMLLALASVVMAVPAFAQADGPVVFDVPAQVNPFWEGLPAPQHPPEPPAPKLRSTAPTITSQAALESHLLQQFQTRNTNFEFVLQMSYSNQSELEAIFDAARLEAFAQDDHTHFSVHSWSYGASGYWGSMTVSCTMTYLTSAAELAQVNSTVQSVLATLIQPGMSDYQKALAIHDWIISNVAYDHSLTYYSDYAALQLGTTVCQGYSLLFYKMCDVAGLPVRIVDGGSAMNHAWNLVQVCGTWYHVDVTWDDQNDGGWPVEQCTWHFLLSDADISQPVGSFTSGHSWVPYPYNPYPAAPVTNTTGEDPCPCDVQVPCMAPIHLLLMQ